ncbi:hypothetical protein HmCmsJML243_04142 [Escherichia coli]|nr:hypothetical protein HmCmsJML243_04142 [Escherichia coli]
MTVLLAVPPEYTSSLPALLMTVLVVVPLTITLPPLLTMVLIALWPESTDSCPPFSRSTLLALPLLISKITPS